MCVAIIGSQEPVAVTHLFESVVPDGLAGVLLSAELAVFCFTEGPGEDTSKGHAPKTLGITEGRIEPSAFALRP